MRVVGLISGGKDSVWNLHYCRHFHHEVVCVANLAPPASVMEMDSYMYQTVGSDLIDAIAAALGLPLVRRTITGKPKLTSSNAYSPQDGDEVEDLTLLLQDVLQAHPDVQAVSCGAILSNYQRLRVENVCARLGLKVLAFMWRQEQELLLRQMISAGLDARIVKVASMGLKARHVGESILSPAFAEHLFGLGTRWGVHVCGEGGEYESAVVDAPLYRHAVQILASETVAHPEGGDDVAFLRVTEAKAGEPHELGTGPPFAAFEAYSSLRYYEETFPQLLDAGSNAGMGSLAHAGGRALPAFAAQEAVKAHASRPAALPQLQQVGQILVSSSLDAGTFGLPVATDPAEQCEKLLVAVSSWLREHGASLDDAAFSELQVRDLSYFEAVNAAYARHFGADPPPRICIQTPLPQALHVRIRLLLRSRPPQDGEEAAAPPADGESLRVQSISTWAMACIGPYSQACRLGPLLLSAGVIGLVPHSMALPTPAQAAAATLANSLPPSGLRQWEAELWLLMRSLRNVLEVMGSGFGEVCLAHVYVAGSECNLREACERVLGYLRREAAGVLPIMACARVPRLPKDSSVEVNVVCAASDGGVHAAPSTASTVHEQPAAPVPGTLSRLSRKVPGARVSMAEFILADTWEADKLHEHALAYAVEQCALAVLEEAQGGSTAAGDASGGFSLQVQFALPGADGVAAAAAEAATASLGIAGACATSCMPVLSLGPGTLVRCLVLVS